MSVMRATKRGSLLLAPLALAGAAGSALATEVTVKIPETTITASFRGSFVASQSDDPAVVDSADFILNNVNLYLNSKITEKVKLSLSTEINNFVPSSPAGLPETTGIVLADAIAQFELDPTFNIWAGRFLPPTDRSNSYGWFFGNNWNFAVDGTQDGFIFTDRFGRADGVAYWGDFGDKVKVSAGVFDVPGTYLSNDVMTAARVQYSFWDFEPGYYMSGTYLGDKDILAVGVATNMVDTRSTTSVDFMLEKKVGDGGAFTVEGMYIVYDEFGGYLLPPPNSAAVTDTVAASYTDGDGWYLLGSYLFPGAVGPGKVSVMGKFGTTTYVEGLASGQDLEMDTTEVNLNYWIKGFNTRLTLYYLGKAYSSDAAADTGQLGLGVQLMTL